MILGAFVTIGCSLLGTSPSASGGCSDVRAPGAVRELESTLPRALHERAPDVVDSGWNCTTQALGTYASHGMHTLWFAGATWDEGGGNATVIAVLSTGVDAGEPALQAAWVEEFYETGARASSKTENIEVLRPAMTGAGEVFRLETLNELSLQTVVVWPDPPHVRVVIVATRVAPGASRTEHDLRVDDAVIVAAGAPVP